MHWSGTSAHSRLLNLVGCDLQKTLMKPILDNNETGFFESQPLSNLNRDILLSAGSDWDDWWPLASGWCASLKAGSFREQAQALLHQEFGDSRLFVLKDPRLCRLLPFWIEMLETFGAEPRVVLPIHNPLDVVASLKRRDGIETFRGYLVWLRYVLDAEAGSRNLRRTYSRYETLLSEPHATMDRLGRDLDVSWPRRASVRGHAEIERFLSPELHHHRTDDAAFLTNPALSRWLGQCFELFSRWSRGEVCETDVALLDRIGLAFDEATPLFRHYIASCEKAVSERDKRIETLSEEVAERNGRIETLSDFIVALNGHSELLTREIDFRDLTIKTSHETIKASHETIKALHETIKALHESSSWRITAPLRFVWEIARVIPARGCAALSRIARTVYLRMPLPYSLKIRSKGILFRSIPFLFRHTAAYRGWSAINSVRDRLVTARASRPTFDADGPRAERRRSGCSTETGATRNRSVAARVAELNSIFTKTSDVCIVFHVYYEDVAKHIVSEFLEPLSGEIDVFVTTHDMISMEMLDYLEERLPGLYVMLCENRGRDIRPFLQALPLVIENGYEISCKIHTKKSPHRFNGSEWGICLLESLLNLPAGIQEIVQTFSRSERLGLIVPPYSPLLLEDPYFHHDDTFWLDHLLAQMGEAGQIGRYEFVFPAGSMFWFRVRALAKLADREFIGLNKFESEMGQLGGALQHSIERIVILLCEKSGFDWMIGLHRPNFPEEGRGSVEGCFAGAFGTDSPVRRAVDQGLVR